MRIFRAQDLQKRPSVVRGLKTLGADLTEGLRDLVERGLLEPRGRKRYEASSDGSLVKHAFNDMKDTLALAGGTPLTKESPEWLPRLRRAMEEDCRKLQQLRRAGR